MQTIKEREGRQNVSAAAGRQVCICCSKIIVQTQKSITTLINIFISCLVWIFLNNRILNTQSFCMCVVLTVLYMEPVQ